MKKVAPSANFECVELDLDSLDAVVRCASAVKALAPALHVLVLNAGAKHLWRGPMGSRNAGLLAMGDRETTKVQSAANWMALVAHTAA